MAMITFVPNSNYARTLVSISGKDSITHIRAWATIEAGKPCR